MKKVYLVIEICHDYACPEEDNAGFKNAYVFKDKDQAKEFKKYRELTQEEDYSFYVLQEKQILETV